MRQLLAAWLVVDEQDLPMNPRLLGKPGVGKTTLAYAAGKRLGREVYIMQATMDTRPEDLLVTPVIEGEGQLRYVASPLVTAMIRGGVAILDEGNRMSEKSWASLAPLLDNAPLRRVHRGRHQDQGAPAVPPRRHHERRRLHLRAARVHPLAPAAADPHRFPGARRGVPDPAREPALRRRAHPALRDRFPAAGPRRRRALHRARRHQHRPLRHQAEEPGHARRRTSSRRSKPPSSRPSARRRCAMSGDIDRLVPDVRQPRARALHVLPGRARAGWSSPSKCARPSCGSGRRWSRSSCPPRCKHAWLRAVERLPEMSVIFYPDEGDGGRRAPSTCRWSPPTRSPRRSARRSRSAPRSSSRTPMSASGRTCRTSTRTRTRSATSASRSTSRPTASTRSRARRRSRAHAAGIAWKLQGADPLATRVGGGLAQPARPGARRHGGAAGAAAWRAPRREGVELLNPHPECLAEITIEYPYLQWRYEQFRADLRDRQADRPPPARSSRFSARPRRATKPTPAKRVAHWQRRLLARYTRNLALAGGQLAAGLFDLTVAARGVVDDNYAWDVWETAGKYPPQKTADRPADGARSPARRSGSTPARSACAAACPARSAACARSG